LIDIQRFWLYWWKETIKFDSLYIRSLGKFFILNRRNICSFFYEFSISRSSIFEPASHRIPHPSSSRVPSSFPYLSRRTHQKLSCCVVMTSRTESQKIFVQTQDENIKTKSPPSFFKFFVDPSVYLQRVRQKGDFQCILLFSTFEIIKMRIARKVSRYSPWTTDFIYNSWC
jgi:hypothetical protein